MSHLRAVGAAEGLCIGGVAIAAAVSVATAPLSPKIAWRSPWL